MTITPARLRALGTLLIEAGLIGLVIWRRVGSDPTLSHRIASLAARLRSL